MLDGSWYLAGLEIGGMRCVRRTRCPLTHEQGQHHEAELVHVVRLGALRQGGGGGRRLCCAAPTRPAAEHARGWRPWVKALAAAPPVRRGLLQDGAGAAACVARRYENA